MTNPQFLSQFANARCPEAYSTVSRRYVDLVYSTARRIVGDTHLAEDITQAAFLVLAKKVKTVNPRHLPGWLVNTTRLAAKEAMRSKRLRDKHEAGATQIRNVIARPDDEPTVNDLTPLLDDALSRLSETDRSAVVMRFLQGLSFAEVGAAMGTSEEAARKRVHRAVEKLRSIFSKQGIIPSAGGLMVVLASQQAKSVPAALVNSVTTAAAAGGTGSSVTIAKGVLSAMTWAKIKLAGMVVAALTLAGGVGIGAEAMRRAMAAPPATTSGAATFKATLKNGVVVELLAVGENPSTGKPWWRPDGSPLAVAPYDRMNGTSTPDQGKVSREFAFLSSTEVEGENGPASLFWSFGSLGYAGRTGYDAAGRPVPGVIAHSTALPADVPATVRVRVAAGPWETAATSNAQGMSATSSALGTFIMSRASERDGSVLITISTSNTDVDKRVIAKTKSGPDLVASSEGSAGMDQFQQSGWYFPNTSVEEITEVHCQTRPFDQWIEFRNVSLQTGVKTEMEIVTSDDEAAAEVPAGAPGLR